MYNIYKWLCVGTDAPTEKRARVNYDIPFHKLSEKSLEQIPRGFPRRDTAKIPQHWQCKQGMA